MNMSIYSKEDYQKNKTAYNERRNKYRQKNVKRIPLDVHVDWYEILKTYCDANGLQVNAFIKSACEQVALQNDFHGFEEYHNKPNNTRESIR